MKKIILAVIATVFLVGCGIQDATNIGTNVKKVADSTAEEANATKDLVTATQEVADAINNQDVSPIVNNDVDVNSTSNNYNTFVVSMDDIPAYGDGTADNPFVLKWAVYDGLSAELTWFQSGDLHDRNCTVSLNFEQHVTGIGALVTDDGERWSKASPVCDDYDPITGQICNFDVNGSKFIRVGVLSTEANATMTAIGSCLSKKYF